jgi:hypothetical protein
MKMSLVDHGQKAIAAIERAIGGSIPETASNPLDKALIDLRNAYTQRTDELDDLKIKYEATESRRVEAVDSSHYWKGQADFFRDELEKTAAGLEIANAKLIELATKGKLMVDIGRAFTEIVNRLGTKEQSINEFLHPNHRDPQTLGHREEEETMPEFLNTKLPENKL